MRQLRLVLIGSGRAARQHFEAVQRLPSIALAGICEPVPDTIVPSWAAQLPKYSVEQVWGDADLDMVGICTPPGTHEPLAAKCLEAGKAVVLEKPAAGSMAAFESILRKRNGTGLPVAVMHQHRHILPSAALNHSWSANAVIAVEIYKHRPVAYFHSASWRTHSQLSGGGSFAHLGVHYLDLACQCLGTPAEIRGFVCCDHDSIPRIETRVVLAGKFHSGAVLSVVCDSTTNTGRHERLSIRDGPNRLEIVNGSCLAAINDSDALCLPVRPTEELRAAVYSAIVEALWKRSSSVSRFDVDLARGVTFVLDYVNTCLRPETSTPLG